MQIKANHNHELSAKASVIFGEKTALALEKAMPQKGRAALTNLAGRFEKLVYETFDDGWEQEPLAPFKTEVTVETPRKIITYNKSPDIPFDRSINAYRGCEHGCSYCFARPSHAYMGFSAGLDFETKLFAKTDAALLFRKEISSPNYEVKPIALGTNTDPYQPIEKKYQITRQLLKVCLETNHPVTIVTKSHLVTRDIDILELLAAKNLVKVALSITTLDRELARKMEPRASTPMKRLEAIKLLTEKGIPCLVMNAPIIPGLNDAEIEEILSQSFDAGAREAGYVLLRMPLEIKDLFREWLVANKPDAARRVLNLIKDMRGGRDYDPQYFTRQTGTGPYADMIAKRFQLARTKLGLGKKSLKLDCTQFINPQEASKPKQLSFF